MGFSITASHLVWGLALLGAAGGVITAFFSIEHATQAGAETMDARVRSDLTASRATGTACYNGKQNTVTVTATYSGAEAVSFANTTLVLDGVPRLSTTWTIQGGPTSTDAWLPHETAIGTIPNVATSPSRLLVSFPSGASSYLTVVSCPYLNTIVVTPSSVSLQVGSTQDFTAQGYDQFGAAYAATYTWTTTTGTISAISGTAAHLVSGTASGTFTVTAQNATVTGSATVTLTPAAPASVTVANDPTGVPAGGTATFTATVLDAYGNVNTTAPVTWSTSAGTISGSGVLTAQTTPASGKTVTATTTGSVSGSASVTVYAGQPTSIAISPTSATVNTTLTQQFTATASDAYGNTNTTATITWNATRGSVSSSGLYTAPATVGTDYVGASTNGQTAIAVVTVQKAIHITSITMYKNNATCASPGCTFSKNTDNVDARVTIVDQLGNPVSGVSVTLQWIRPNANVDHTDTGSSVANGTANFYMVAAAPTGSWSVKVTGMSGTGLWWNAALDATETQTFTTA